MSEPLHIDSKPGTVQVDLLDLRINRMPRPEHEPLSPLAHPRWGLAWSNPDGISTTALIQNALLRGSFTLILEACAVHGIERVRAEWENLRQNPEECVSQRLATHVNGLLENITKGIALAKT